MRSALAVKRIGGDMPSLLALVVMVILMSILMSTRGECLESDSSSEISNQLEAQELPLPRPTDDPSRRTISVLLIVPPYSGHITPFFALAEELISRGHNVTLLSGPVEFVLRRAKEIGVNFLSLRDEGFVNTQEILEMAREGSGKGAAGNIDLIINLSILFQQAALKLIDNSEVQSYDVIVGDAVFANILRCFSKKWNIPSVHIWVSLSLHPDHFYPWSFPQLLSGYTDDLTFFQRLVTYVSNKALMLLMSRISAKMSFMKEVCSSTGMKVEQGHRSIHSIPQIVTSSYGFEFSRVHTPLIQYVGPILSQSPPPLTQDMVEWLDQKDPRSVVYVSMGSTAILTASEAESIVNGATGAGHSVVWSLRKTNQDILEKMSYDSERVLVAGWAPQLSLLRHPSIHSAILHGGLGGVQEALSCGIPIIVVPFFADQLDNAVRVHHHHYGRMIHRHKLTSDLVSQSLRLFDSELYHQSLLRIQRIYRQDGGGSRAADLLEFYSEVGYQHLVPAYVKYNWSWIEFYNIDVMAVLALAVILPTFLLYRTLLCCYRTAFSKPKNKTE